MTLDYRVLGPLEVWADGRRLDVGGARQRRLIGALVLAAGRPVTAERLIDIVWVGDPPAQARNTLRTYVARARRALEVDGDTPLHTDANGWRLEREVETLDSERFENLLSQARAMSADPLAALGTVEEALSLWRDDAFAEFGDEGWCAGEAVRLDELRLAAEEERFEAMLGCGLYDDVIGELERFTERHPLRDRPRGQHMLALYRAGRQVEAVRAFQRYRRLLQSEVGVEASDELRTLEQRIVQRDPSLRQLAPAGRQLRGYRLGPPIGEGAFGRIYRATQPALGREVAIKVVRPELADDREFIRRFDAEAQIVARLEHPHIVPLFDYWREPGGAYLVMRYLRGGTASQLLQAHGPLTLDRAVRVVDEIGGALAAAHAQRVVHRDVKPANILFDEYGSSYLGDFGIATGMGPAGDPAAGAGSVTSAVYLSPEQASSGEVAASADIYALGVVLFELLVGEPPFPRGTPMPDLIHRKREQSIPCLTEIRPELPHALDDLIRRATAPEPEDRFASIGEMVSSLHAVVTPGERGRSRAALGVAARNPYKGLAAFDEADAADFFGRERLVEQIRDHLETSRFVMIVGPSGSGKSSVVRAGVAPMSRAAGSYVVAMIPGKHPMEELTRALLRVTPEGEAGRARVALRRSADGLVTAVERGLAGPATELVLIVDQFEEIFTVADEGEREEFLQALAAAAGRCDSRIRVIATIRADFYDRPLSHAGISGLVQANTVAVSPLAPAELERAITEPAARVGVSVEPGLVAALVADFAGTSGALPLVQFELTQLFDQRDGDTLELAAYARHGGLAGAVSGRADEIYDSADEAARNDIRQLFGRLVTPGEGTDDTRRRVRHSELAVIDPGVVSAYAQARLLTFDHDPLTREPTVEVAHEALIAGWPRLRRWVDQDREGLAMLRHLTASADDWEAAGRDPSELYRGGRLLAAEEWADSHPGELSPAEQAFIDASIHERDADAAREQRRVRRLRALVVVSVAVAVIALVAGLLAFRARQAADDNAAEAERRALENRAAQLTSQAMLASANSDPDLAILLALAADDVSSGLGEAPQPGVASALHETVQASRLERIIPAGREQIDVSPDGRHMVLDDMSDRRRLLLYDLEAGRVVTERALDDLNGGLAYSPDGSLLAVSFADRSGSGPAFERGRDRPAMLLLNPITLETVRELDGGLMTWLPSWSADGRSVLAVGVFGDTRMWNVDDSAVARVVAGPDADMVSFVPGTDSIAILDEGKLEIVERDTGEVLQAVEAPEGSASMSFSADGGTVAFVDFSGRRVHLVDLRSGELRMTIDHPSPRDVRFSPDGSSLSISGNSDSVRVVELDSGEAIELRGHGSGSSEHTFSPDSEHLFAASIGGSTRVWNLSAAGPDSLGNLALGGPVVGGARVVDEASVLVPVATGSNEAELVRVDPSTGDRQHITDVWFESFKWPVFAPDGSLVAGFSPVTSVAEVIDTTSGAVLLSLRPCETPKAVDARYGWVLVDQLGCADEAQASLAAEARRGFVDLATGELTRSIDDRGPVSVAAAGWPGSLAEDVLAYHAGGRVVFRSAVSGEEMTAWGLPPGVPVLDMAFSPDGSSLGVSAQTRQVFLFDVEAVLDGVAAGDAVTVFEEMGTGPTAVVVPVGDSLVTTHETQVRQWDPASGELLAEVTTDPGRFVIAFAMPDDSSVLYLDAGGVLRRFRTDHDDLVALALARVQRGFTDAECQRFFPDGDCPDPAVASE